MTGIDLNLLTALDVLLAERSVTGAAARLGLSVSAMSRTLARLRAATGDRLLVSAGRALVPTPYAEALADRVHTLAQDVAAVLRPVAGAVDLRQLDRTFVIRANEMFVELAAAALIEAAIADAPKVRIRFLAKPDKDPQPLRDGAIDLEIGTVGETAPELRSQLLYRDRFVGLCRADHSMLIDGKITPERYAACRHVVVSRKGRAAGPVDRALDALGLARTVSLVVPTMATAVQVARRLDYVALVTRGCLGPMRSGPAHGDRELACFDLPVSTPPVNIVALWHPRFDGDPAHRWLRETIRTVCDDAGIFPASGGRPGRR